MLKINLKIIFSFIILTIIVLTTFTLANEPYTLTCNEFLWCLGSAHCNGPGWQTELCVIECEGGGQITCPKNDEWFQE